MLTVHADSRAPIRNAPQSSIRSRPEVHVSRPLLAFLHVAKTGGRSVETMLRSTYGPAYCHALVWREPEPAGRSTAPFQIPTYDHADFHRLERLNPWMRAVGGHALALWTGLHELRPVRYFAFLRDPLQRAASHYQFHVAESADPLDWEQWCAWHEPHNQQVRRFTRDGGAAEAIAAIERHGVFVGLMEHFDESLVLLRKLVAPELNLAYLRSNVAPSNDLAKSILADPVRSSRLQELNREEQPLYDHVTQVLMPAWRAAYGPSLAEDVAQFTADRARGFNHLNDRLHRAVYRLYWNPALARGRQSRS